MITPASCRRGLKLLQRSLPRYQDCPASDVKDSGLSWHIYTTTCNCFCGSHLTDGGEGNGGSSLQERGPGLHRIEFSNPSWPKQLAAGESEASDAHPHHRQRKSQITSQLSTQSPTNCRPPLAAAISCRGHLGSRQIAAPPCTSQPSSLGSLASFFWLFWPASAVPVSQMSTSSGDC